MNDESLPLHTRPLVSVIIRSMDRPSLMEALGSLALQTYPSIEVVLVNATGAEHGEVDQWCGQFPVRMIETGEQLHRSRAANLGLDTAQGEYLLFLDDDDLLLPEHIARLADAMQDHPEAAAAYGGVAMQDLNGNTVLEFDDPWQRDRFRGANFLPIHSILFKRAHVAAGCRFAEELTCLEDWDFWQQIAQKGEFIHVPGISAIYRFQLGLSELTNTADFPALLANRARIMERWLPRYSAGEWAKTLHYYDMMHHEARNLRKELSGLQAQCDNLAAERNDLAEERNHLSAERDGLIGERNHLTAERDDLIGERNHLSAERDGLIADRDRLRAECNTFQAAHDHLLHHGSWRFLPPLRWLAGVTRPWRQRFRRT